MTADQGAIASYLDLRPEVAEALVGRRPVVALESTAIALGLPRPRNLETARQLEQSVRAEGATPATVALIGGRIRVGLAEDELAAFASRDDVAKASRRDLGHLLATGRAGATTVAATLAVCTLAGIRVFATGGIGAVHRGGNISLDISADLAALAVSPVALVSAGAKLILDLEKTLEVLETKSVPVIGYGCDEFPAFYCRSSGLALDARVDTPEEAAAVLRAHWTVGGGSGVLFANPVPEAAALDRAEVEGWIETALAEADAAGVTGKAVTPFLLDRLAALSGGRTVEANIALLDNNARVAAQIARADAALAAG
jgi:pseudouridine-5'-phosphate glycosidase